MGRKLTCNIFLRENPPLGDIKFFLAGQEVPAWAEEALKGCDHLFTNVQEASPEVHREAAGGDLPAEPKVEVPEPKTPEVPKRNGSQVAWKRFAEQVGIGVPDSATRDQIIELVESQRPDLLIPQEEG